MRAKMIDTIEYWNFRILPGLATPDSGSNKKSPSQYPAQQLTTVQINAEIKFNGINFMGLQPHSAITTGLIALMP